MPILRPHVESPTGTFIVFLQFRWPIRSDLGLLEKQSFPKWEIPCLGRQ